MGYQSSIYSASCEIIAKSNGSMERDYEYTQKRFFSDLKPPETLGNKAAERAIKKLNPKKIKSEKIPIIFEQRVAKSLLDPFADAISASSFARGTSFLKDKLNKNIFSKDINIIDDPLISKALGSQIFDSEGVKSSKVTLVKEGSLENLLLDTYYGKILKMKSNGRSGGTTNLYFENGTKSFKELLNTHTKALYINELIGRGANIITGDYSVGASGMLIENGEFSYPINEITIAGNLSEMFNNITLANDLEFSYATNSPTLMIEGMVVAGK
jgi:PmbA protein